MWEGLTLVITRYSPPDYQSDAPCHDCAIETKSLKTFESYQNDVVSSSEHPQNATAVSLRSVLNVLQFKTLVVNTEFKHDTEGSDCQKNSKLEDSFKKDAQWLYEASWVDRVTGIRFRIVEVDVGFQGTKQRKGELSRRPFWTNTVHVSNRAHAQSSNAGRLKMFLLLVLSLTFRYSASWSLLTD